MLEWAWACITSSGWVNLRDPSVRGIACGARRSQGGRSDPPLEGREVSAMKSLEVQAR